MNVKIVKIVKISSLPGECLVTVCIKCYIIGYADRARDTIE